MKITWFNMKLLATAEHRSQVCHLTALSSPSSQSLNIHSVPGWHVATLHRYNSNINYQHTQVISLVCAKLSSYCHFTLGRCLTTDHSRNAKLTFVFSALENDHSWNIVGQDQEFCTTDAGKWLFKEKCITYNNTLYIGRFSWLEKMDDNCSTMIVVPLHSIFLYSRSAFLFGAVYYCILLEAGLKKSLFGHTKINQRLSVCRFMWYSPDLHATSHTANTFEHQCCFKKDPLVPITNSLSDMNWNESWRVY
jgi:hypothetical protein